MPRGWSESFAPAELAEISQLVVFRDGRKKTGHGLWPGGSETKRTGDAAERFVLDYLARMLSEKEAAPLWWCAALGEIPGWDLEYRDSEERLTGVEVKGTKGKRFAGVILTSNEYSAAERMGDRYILALVIGVPTSPQICLVTAPIACIRAGTVAAQPSAWKLEWRADP